MRFYEFGKVVKEDLSENSLRSLKSIIAFLNSKIESENAEPKISSSLLTTMMQNRGYESFNFKDLLMAYNESPELQALISKPEKNSMIEILQNVEPDVEPGLEQGQDQMAPMQGMEQQPMDLPAQPDMAQTPMGADQEVPISAEPSGPIESPQGTIQTVKSMAKKALKRRQD